MSVRLFAGGRIKTLTDAILADVRAGNAAWPERRGLILVPEDRKLNIERAYLDRSDAGNLMMAEVLSFNRLTMRLLSDLGLFNEPTLNRRMQAVIMRRLLFEKKDELKYYRNRHADPSSPDRLNSILREFRQCRISPDDLRALQAPDKETGDLFHDLALLGQAYADFLADKDLHDSDSRLLQLLSELDKLQAGAAPELTPAAWRLRQKLAKTSVWVDGYGEHHQLSALQYRLLTALEKLCLDLTVSLVSRPADRGRRAKQNLFSRAGGLTLYNRLKEIFPAAETLVVDDKGNLTDGREGGAHGPLPGPEGLPFTTADRLFLWELPDPEAELMAAAGEIRRLKEAGLCRYREVAVVCPVEEIGPERVRSCFAEVGVPVFLKLDSRAVLAEIPKLLLSALDCIRNGWQAADVMAWLRSGPICDRPETADLWETYCLQYGLFGYRLRSERIFEQLKAEQEKKDRPKKIAGNLAAADFMIAFRQAYLVPLFDLEDKIRSAKDSHALCRGLLDFMAAFSLERKVETRSAGLLEAGEEAEATALVKSWNETLKLLADFICLTDPVNLTLGEFRHILAAGFEQLGADIIPSTLDQVTIGNAHMAIGSRADILFILSADRDHLPPSSLPENPLKPADRLFLAQALQVDLPDLMESKAVWDLFSLEQLRLLPDRRLYLSYSRPAVPAQLFREAKALAEVRYFPDDIQAPSDPRLYHPAVARSFLLAQAQVASVTEEAYRELAVRTLQADPEAFQAALLPFSGNRPGSRKQVTLQEASRRLTASQPVDMSISRLERYASCPYRYFFDYILGAEERRVAEPAGKDIGSLYHKIMERAAARFQQDGHFRELLADPAAWPRIWTLTRAYLRQLIDTEASYYAFRKPELRQSVLETLAQRSANAIIGYFANQEAGIGSIYTEWGFGFDHPDAGRGPVLHPPVPSDQATDPAVAVSFRGLIDRVDVFADAEEKTKTFKLLDYKSRDRKVNLARICNGLDFQLPIYCAAWQLNHPDQEPAAVGYLGLDHDADVKGKASTDNLVETVASAYKAQLFTGEMISFKDLEATGLAAAQARLTELLQGDFSVQPRVEGVDISIGREGKLVEKRLDQAAKIPCDDCAASGLCRIDMPARAQTVLTKTWSGSTETAESGDSETDGKGASDGQEAPDAKA